MKKFLLAVFFTTLLLILILISSAITESAELSGDAQSKDLKVEVGREKRERLSPIPLLRIFTKEKKLDNKDIYVISMTYLEEVDEITAMYMENSGCLVVVAYKEGDEKKRVSQLYQYDTVIPPKEIRQYYAENAPRAELLLEKWEQREQSGKGDGAHE